MKIRRKKLNKIMAILDIILAIVSMVLGMSLIIGQVVYLRLKYLNANQIGWFLMLCIVPIYLLVRYTIRLSLWAVRKLKEK